MASFLSQITIISILALIVLLICLIFGVFPTREKDISKNTGKKAKIGTPKLGFYELKSLNTHASYPIYCKTNQFITVGKSSDCDIVLKESSSFIGRQHAYISLDDKGYFLQDNNSTNGCYNEEGEAVKEIALTNGVKFFIADEPYEFHAVNPFKKKETMSSGNDGSSPLKTKVNNPEKDRHKVKRRYT